MSHDPSLIIATTNAGKTREFENLLHELLSPSWTVYDRSSWPGSADLAAVVEDRDTFAGNAVKKALETSLAADVCALSDDSGLVVDALGGQPGIHSARYAAAAGQGAGDDANNRYLIQQLEGVPLAERWARYVAVVCLALVDDPIGRALLERRGLRFDDIPASSDDQGPAKEGQLSRVGDRALVWFEDCVEGLIIDTPRGDGGFGYDPHFLVPSWNQTMAEVPLDKKNTISHRARAIRKLVAYFR